METPGTQNNPIEDRELRLLMVEDSEADAELTIRCLKAAGFR